MSRRLGEHEDDSERKKARELIIECSEKPLFQCPNCVSEVDEEQSRIWYDILTQFPDAELIMSTRRLINALYVKFPTPIAQDANFNLDHVLRQIDGVVRVTPHGDLELKAFKVTNYSEYIGAHRAQAQFCVTGHGVRIAVIDTGIDYTHYPRR